LSFVENDNLKQWISSLVISTSYLAVMVNIQGFIGLMPFVVDEFSISMAEAGLYSSFYFLSATIVALFSGRIVDRLGTKNGMILGVSIMGTMMILHSFSPSFSLIFFLAFFTGVGFSLITPSISKGIFENVKSKKRNFFMSIAHSGGGVGGFLGAALLPSIGIILGWRVTLLIAGCFALVVGLFIFQFYKSKYKSSDSDIAYEVSEDGESTEIENTSFIRELVYLLHNPLLLCFGSMGVVFGISVSSVTGHLPLYLTQDLNISPSFAGFMLGVFHVGGILGLPSLALLNEKLFLGDKRKGLFVMGLFISGIAFIFGFLVSQFDFPPLVVLFLSFLLGFCIMGMTATYFTAVGELVEKKLIGLATGIALIFARIGFVTAPPLFGFVADLYGCYEMSWIILGVAVLIISSTFLFLSAKIIAFARKEQAPTK